MSLIDDLRAGPINQSEHPDKATLAVQIHRLREKGYGIRLEKVYVLMYEPDMAQYNPHTTIPPEQPG